jgi:hypothetical protein
MNKAKTQATESDLNREWTPMDANIGGNRRLSKGEIGQGKENRSLRSAAESNCLPVQESRCARMRAGREFRLAWERGTVKVFDHAPE